MPQCLRFQLGVCVRVQARLRDETFQITDIVPKMSHLRENYMEMIISLSKIVFLFLPVGLRFLLSEAELDIVGLKNLKTAPNETGMCHKNYA